jgi:hypothetical protein
MVKVPMCRNATIVMSLDILPKIAPRNRRIRTRNLIERRYIFPVFSAGAAGKNEWYLDSGATSHMANKRESMGKFEKVEDSITVANNSSVKVVGKGQIELDLNCDGQKSKVEIRDVLFVPGLTINLLSVSSIADHGHTFDKYGCQILDEHGELMASGRRDGGPYKLDRFEEKSFAAAKVTDSNLWHRRLGHLNQNSMNLMKKGMVTGVDFDENRKTDCVTCCEGKQCRLKFPKKGSRSNEILGRIHSDLCGPMENIVLWEETCTC